MPQLQHGCLVLATQLARARLGPLALPDVLLPPLTVRGRAARPTADECAQLEAEAAAGGVARVVIDLLAGADTTIPPGLATDAAATIAAALRDAGWIVVYSARLNAEVIFSRDADVAIPDEHAALPRFDQAELAVLAAEQPSADRLRAIVDVKREMPGTREVGDSGERLTPARDVFAPPRTKGGRRS